MPYIYNTTITLLELKHCFSVALKCSGKGFETPVVTLQVNVEGDVKINIARLTRRTGCCPGTVVCQGEVQLGWTIVDRVKVPFQLQGAGEGADVDVKITTSALVFQYVGHLPIHSWIAQR